MAHIRFRSAVSPLRRSTTGFRRSAPAEDVQRFFAQGMLINVLGALDAPSVDEPWAQLLMGADDC